MRHGEALSESADPRRPLSDFGRQQVRSVGRLALERNAKPAGLFHSGILRAEETAQLLRSELAIESCPLAMTGLLPEDDPFVVKAEVETFKEPMMLVGHLPHLQRLTGLLVAHDPERRIVDFAPANMVCLARGDESWTVEWLIGPGYAKAR